jgi:hypothetical protein
MPVNMVKTPEEEHYWTKAKKLAEKQGRAKDWAYIVGIFKRMSGKSADQTEVSDLKKSLGTTLAATPRFIVNGAWAGQVPNKARIQELRLGKEDPMPKPATMARLMAHDGAYLSPDRVVDGIGLDRGKENDWRNHLRKAANTPNELTFRQDILQKMLQDRLDSSTRQALFQRSMIYYRDMKKSLVSVVTPDDLQKSLDAVPMAPGDRLAKAIRRRVARHSKGLPLSDLRDLVQVYGANTVGAELQKSVDMGIMTYENETLFNT